MCSPWLRKKSNRHRYRGSIVSKRVAVSVLPHDLQNSETETRDLQILVSMGVSLHKSCTGSEEAKTDGQAERGNKLVTVIFCMAGYRDDPHVHVVTVVLVLSGVGSAA
jgi:hypothetical protein